MLEFSRKIFEKCINLHENSPSGNRVVPWGLTDRRTHMTKLMVAFCSFAHAPKSKQHWCRKFRKCEAQIRL